MTLQVGVAITENEVRLVARRGKRSIRWSSRSTEGKTFGTTVAEMLMEIPRRTFERTRVVAIAGPSMVQVRRMSGVPKVGDSRVATTLVRQSPARFFLGSADEEIATSELYVPGDDGDPWGAAITTSLLGEIVSACTAAKCRLVAVAPTVAVVGAAVDGAECTWHDGNIVTEIRLSPKRLPLDFVRSTSPSVNDNARHAGPRGDELNLNAGLSPMAGDAVHYAGAFAAASWLGVPPMAFTTLDESVGAGRSSEGTGGWGGAVPKWRVRLAAAAMAAATVVWIAAPGVRAELAIRDGERRLLSLAAQRGEASSLEAKVREVTEALRHTTKFMSVRRSTSLLLADLARLLPQETGVVSVRTDSTGALVVLVAASVANVMPAFEKMPLLASPEIVGAVTRETMAGRELERATIRAAWARVREAPGGVAQ